MKRTQRKTVEQVQETVKRFENKYTRDWRLLKALDAYLMRTLMVEDAHTYLSDRMTTIEQKIKR